MENGANDDAAYMSRIVHGSSSILGVDWGGKVGRVSCVTKPAGGSGGAIQSSPDFLWRMTGRWRGGCWLLDDIGWCHRVTVSPTHWIYPPSRDCTLGVGGSTIYFERRSWHVSSEYDCTVQVREWLWHSACHSAMAKIMTFQVGKWHRINIFHRIWRVYE